MDNSKMESDSLKTPTQIVSVSPTLQLANGQKHLTPNCKYNPYNPMSIGKSTPNTFQRKTGQFSMFKNVLNTPPSRFSKVINPFENGLTERLHLPLICSPSLFHRPSTPQLSQSNFEWTIDEMSSLNPANFEAHETQFMSTTDPENEARFQAAISSYFRDQINVPSPIDCPLRKQKIILSDEPVVKNTRDGICQTELSFPPNLPKDIEDVLKPYFSQTMNQQQSPVKPDCDTTIDHDARDASLRRKLFNESITIDDTCSLCDECDENVDLEGLSPPPISPETVEMNCTHIQHRDSDSANLYGTPSRSSRNEKSFGSLSPIMLTPTKSLSHSFKHNRSYQSTSSIYRSTPERNLRLSRTSSSNSVDMLDESREKFLNEARNVDSFDKDVTLSSSTDDEKRLSYVRTPNRRKHRYASRKNLSHSFSCLNEVDNDGSDVKKPVSGSELNTTDCGFNEMDDVKRKTGRSMISPSKSTVQYVNDIMDVDSISPRGK